MRRVIVRIHRWADANTLFVIFALLFPLAMMVVAVVDTQRSERVACIGRLK